MKLKKKPKQNLKQTKAQHIIFIFNLLAFFECYVLSASL